MRDSFVVLKNIYKSFYKDSIEIRVLNNISISFNKGEKIAITGKSGSGKSTLLNIIGTLEAPTKGKVIIKKIDTTNLDEDSLSLLRNTTIGFVFQFHYLIKELTALENVMLPALIKGESYNNAKNRAETLLKELSLSHRITHKPTELSGGEQQRVAIARALINEPELLLADEPTGNLDTKNSEITLKLLDNFHKKFNLTLIIATHNLDIAKMCNRIIKLEDGKISEIF